MSNSRICVHTCTCSKHRRNQSYSRVNDSLLAKRPSTVTDVEGAALISDGVLAFTALHYKCRVSAGDSILIMNAASVRNRQTCRLGQIPN